jgi:hypothetical protein
MFNIAPEQHRPQHNPKTASILCGSERRKRGSCLAPVCQRTLWHLVTLVRGVLPTKTVACLPAGSRSRSAKTKALHGWRPQYLLSACIYSVNETACGSVPISQPQELYINCVRKLSKTIRRQPFKSGDGISTKQVSSGEADLLTFRGGPIPRTCPLGEFANSAPADVPPCSEPVGFLMDPSASMPQWQLRSM